MKKALRITIAILIAFTTVILIAFSAYFIITGGSNLEPDKLLNYNKSIIVYDDDGNKIESASSLTKRKSVKVENLHDYTINAFIASEDRQFYRHNGLNYKRMVKAFFTNIANRSFKQGASTISQQLIKNTHLTNEKTLTRKLKEIKLTRQLEKRYDKNEILEMYLNTIYFGHDFYGIEEASTHYFGKNAENLSLNDSATIVGLLTSPNNYSPFKNPDKCLQRRNSVLKSMYDCGYISEEIYDQTAKLPLSAKQTDGGERYASYLDCVFSECEELDVLQSGYNSNIYIKTYLDREIQDAIENVISEYDYSIFLRDPEGGVRAFRSSIGLSRRQAASTFKPLLVFAPAIENGSLHLFSKITDEPVDFGGYAPENYDKKFHGKVTVEESIKNSYNVPAVKTLNTLNLNDVYTVAEEMNLPLCTQDKHLALALGATSNGVNLKELCDGYSVFSRGGSFISSHFIKEISTDDGKILYKSQEIPKNIFSRGTCSLINKALCETVNSGTGKKLKSLGLDLACKTGTTGTAEGNTDAYSICYTGDACLGVWLGDKNNQKLDITGGSDCCAIAREILSSYYDTRTPVQLDKTSGTKEVEIDLEEYEKNDKILLCDKVSPKLNKLKVRCLESNLPKEESTKFSNPRINKPTINVINNQVSIELCQTKYYSYLIKRRKSNEEIVIYDDKWQKTITDIPDTGEYEYEIIPYYSFDGKTFTGQGFTLPKIKISENNALEPIPDIVNKDWSNM